MNQIWGVKVAAVTGHQALCAESASHGGGGCEGEVVPMGGMVDGVERVHSVKGRCLPAIGGGRGGHQGQQKE